MHHGGRVKLRVRQRNLSVGSVGVGSAVFPLQLSLALTALANTLGLPTTASSTASDLSRVELTNPGTLSVVPMPRLGSLLQVVVAVALALSCATVPAPEASLHGAIHYFYIIALRGLVRIRVCR